MPGGHVPQYTLGRKLCESLHAMEKIKFSIRQLNPNSLVVPPVTYLHRLLSYEIERYSYPSTGRGGPSGCERLRLPHFQTFGPQMAARLSALRAGRFLPPGRFLTLISVRG
jgi:hypothetical protein